MEAAASIDNERDGKFTDDQASKLENMFDNLQKVLRSVLITGSSSVGTGLPLELELELQLEL